MFRQVSIIVLVLVLSITALPVAAQEHGHPIHSEEAEGVDAEFDIVLAQVLRAGSNLIFQMVVVGEAGITIPDAIGQVPGAEVLSYVWPTSLDIRSRL